MSDCATVRDIICLTNDPFVMESGGWGNLVIYVSILAIRRRLMDLDLFQETDKEIWIGGLRFSLNTASLLICDIKFLCKMMWEVVIYLICT